MNADLDGCAKRARKTRAPRLPQLTSQPICRARSAISFGIAISPSRALVTVQSYRAWTTRDGRDSPVTARLIHRLTKQQTHDPAAAVQIVIRRKRSAVSWKNSSNVCHHDNRSAATKSPSTLAVCISSCVSINHCTINLITTTEHRETRVSTELSRSRN